MAWIEYHTQLRDHWKIKRLADELAVPYTQALGAISCLWLWCADYAPTGNISKFSDDEIRFAARIDTPKFSKNLLLSTGLLTKGLFINDWGKHGIKLLQSKRKANREYAARKRESGYPLDTDSVAIPNHTIPNRTKPNKKQRLLYIAPENIKKLRMIYPKNDELKKHLIESMQFSEAEVDKAIGKEF